MSSTEYRKINALYEFEPFVVDPMERRLLRNGTVIKIRPKSFDLLLILIEAAGSLRSRDELVRAAWPGSVIEEHGLTVCMSALRKALGETEEKPRYVETVRGHGYRFIAPVKLVEREVVEPTLEAPPTRDVPADLDTPVRSALDELPTKPTAKRRRAIALVAGVAALALLVLIGIRFFNQAETPPPASIAVMPFENIGDRERNAYFASGIQQSILNKLTHIEEIKVISRSSSDQYLDRSTPIAQIAQQLGVATVLEGSVQSVADSVLINVHLIDPYTRRHLWSGSYKRTVDDAIEVESDVASHIVSTLKSRLLPAEAARLSRAPTQNAQAYRQYLKANYYADQVLRTNTARVPAEAVQRAFELYEEAAKLDPSFALAYARHSELALSAFRNGVVESSNSVSNARQLAEKALSIDPELAEAHRAMGYVRYYADFDYPAALLDFRRAVELAPNDPDTLAAIAFIHRRQAKLDEALGALQSISIIDPRSPRWPYETGLTHMMLRQYDDAEQQFALALALEPNHAYCLSFRARALLLAGKPQQADDVLNGSDALPDPMGLISSTRFESAMMQRDPQRALRELEKLGDWLQATTYGPRVPTKLLQADALHAQGQVEEAAVAYKAALALLEGEGKNPSAGTVLNGLTLSQLGAGFPKSALESAVRATREVPVEQDVVDGVFNAWLLARLHARLGQTAEAVSWLEKLLTLHGGMFVSRASLEMDPTWDPIRGEPAFIALLKSR
jgi:TolB-like protein/DNA-binding winged helix-turn-helix (wHTH) protein/predicted Zn-dependent protease